MSCKNRAAGGFSLVEVMIVIVIIGLLAGAVTYNVRSYLNRAKQETARSDISVIVGALDSFWGTYGRYPTNEEGLEALCRPSEKLPEGLLARAPVDPWGKSYQYNCPGRNGPYEVICYGENGLEGGDGVDADITSDDLSKK